MFCWSPHHHPPHDYSLFQTLSFGHDILLVLDLARAVVKPVLLHQCQLQLQHSSCGIMCTVPRTPQPLPLVSPHSLPNILPISSVQFLSSGCLSTYFSHLPATGDWSDGENETRNATFHPQRSVLKVSYAVYLWTTSGPVNTPSEAVSAVHHWALFLDKANMHLKLVCCWQPEEPVQRKAPLLLEPQTCTSSSTGFSHTPVLLNSCCLQGLTGAACHVGYVCFHSRCLTSTPC